MVVTRFGSHKQQKKPQTFQDYSTLLIFIAVFRQQEVDFENITFGYSPYSDIEDVTPCNQEETKIFDKRFVPAFYSIMFILGLLGNSLVIVVMLAQRKQKIQSTDMFILHLAVADILLAVTLPFWAVQTTSGWIFGEASCKIVASVFKINFYAGTFLLACISSDRYFSIVFAVQIYKKHRLHHVHLSCLVVWITCILLCIPDAYFYSVNFEARTNMTECEPFFPQFASKKWKVGMSFLYHICGFLLPFTSMLFCYSHIVITLLKSKGFKKQKALRLIIAVVMAFFFCWAPYNVVAFVDTLNMLGSFEANCSFQKNIDIALSITSGLCYFHSCLNPVLYVFIGEKFRSNLAELLVHTRMCPYLAAKFVRRRTPSTRSSTWSDSGDTSLSGIY
ncbi:PREDICTED: C-X-C chemokine receptor type 3-like [Nanorana parkeri]|uniref:C-X-C chemokine receptor type 3-like n=1 Tax=Nanorana parkeri TaxID=125878 RepID=UPI0008545DC9|nr:PREDICTED: C-X-C chemokine receptor type 3-like [Nanorana parkeri]